MTARLEAAPTAPMLEADLQRLIICSSSPEKCLRRVKERCLAHVFGWVGVHFRPAKTRKGWRVPVEGSLGKGWPDLVLLHPGHKRLILAELKRLGHVPTREQLQILELFGGVPGVTTVVWTPFELDSGEIMRELQRSVSR